MEFAVYCVRYILPVIGVLIAVLCLSSLLKTKSPEVNPASFVDNIDGKEYPITHWETSIGRSGACDIVLDYSTVSRFHAVISKHKKGWVLTDTHSSAGTFVKQSKVTEPTVINDGDSISFGGIVLQFRIK